MVPPGCSSPEASAASIMATAIRSLAECPGLKYSTLAKTVAGRDAVILLSNTKGVFPMVSKIFEAISIMLRYKNYIIRSSGSGMTHPHPLPRLMPKDPTKG